MLTESFQSIATATRQLVRNWGALMVLAGLYASLILALYLFATIRESSAGQVVLSLVLTVTAPFLFFVLQTAGASQTSNLGAVPLLRGALRNSWKVIVVSVPLVALAILLTYLLGKAQSYMGTNGRELSDVAAQYHQRASNDGRSGLRWSQVILTGIRYLSLGLVLPLIAIHLWNASVGRDLWATIVATKDLVVAAFTPRSVLIYTAGFVVFGVIPYLLLFKSISAGKAWVEIAFFVARLLLVFILTLFGWVVTMSALAISASERLEPVRTASGRTRSVASQRVNLSERRAVATRSVASQRVSDLNLSERRAVATRSVASQRVSDLNLSERRAVATRSVASQRVSDLNLSERRAVATRSVAYEFESWLGGTNGP